MNNTFKNSIVGALAIFGLVTFLSSATSSPTVVHEGSNTPESHVWELHLHNELRAYFSINKVTGEVRAHNIMGGDTKKERVVYSISTKNPNLMD